MINTIFKKNFAIKTSAVKPQVTMTPHLSSDRDNLYHHWLDFKNHNSCMIYLLRTCCLQAQKIFILSSAATAPVPGNNTWMTECSDHTSWKQRALQILRTAFYRQLSHQTALPMQQFSSLKKWQQRSQDPVQYKPFDCGLTVTLGTQWKGEQMSHESAKNTRHQWGSISSMWVSQINTAAQIPWLSTRFCSLGQG